MKSKVVSTQSYLSEIQIEDDSTVKDDLNFADVGEFSGDSLIEIHQITADDADVPMEVAEDQVLPLNVDSIPSEEYVMEIQPPVRRGRKPKRAAATPNLTVEQKKDILKDRADELKKVRKRRQRNDMSEEAALMAKQRAHELYTSRTETKALEQLMVEMKVLTCDICTVKPEFTSFRDLRQHFQDDHSQIRRAYIVCCGQKHGLQGARQHMKYHQNPDQFKCDLCEENCLNHRDLLLHKRAKHLDLLESFPCETCGKVFAVRGQLKAHILTHFPDELKKFRCEYCSKGFNCKSTLVAHVKAIHTKQADFCCEICGKAYSSSNSLKTHIASHQEAKTQPCDVCGKQFFNVEKHKRRIHQEVERITCGDCGKAIKKHLFAVHVRDLHSGAVWQCEFCQKVFRMQKTLKEHVNVHLGIKVDCIFCPFKATNSSNIIKHYYQQHPVEYAEHRANRYSEKRVKNVKE